MQADGHYSVVKHRSSNRAVIRESFFVWMAAQNFSINANRDDEK